MFKNKVAYGVYNQQDRINNNNIYLKVKGSTLFYLERLSSKVVLSGGKPISIFCEDDIQTILEKAYDDNNDFCVVLAAGCQIRNWRFYLDLEEFLKENKFGVAGHPLWWPDKAWPELHHQFFIVNLKAWKKSGKPGFGTWENSVHDLPVLERSEENFHDDYTPLWIKSTGKTKPTGGAGQGWQLMAAMFNNGYPVITLSEKLRLSKFYTYPEHETEKFENSLNTLTSYKDQNWNQAKWIDDSKYVKDQIWLFNSEGIKIFNNHGPYDTIVNTASGFKLFDLFDSRIKETTNCVIYDFNQKSLDWYEHFHNWKNDDLLECIRSFKHRGHFTWSGKWNSEYDETQGFFDHIEENYNYFGGKENFIKLWNRFKNMPTIFKQVDLYKNPEELSLLLKGPGQKWINLSNIFSTDATQIIFGHHNCMAAQIRLLGSLYIVDPTIDVTLYDFWNRHKFGFVKDIL